MITIKQFIESIVLDFEPKWIAKDQDGEISVYGTRPSIEADEKFWSSGSDKWQNFGIIKLTEFENCPWEECLWKITPAYDPKWLGKLCKFRDDESGEWLYGILTDYVAGEEYPFWSDSVEYIYCEPVRPDDKVIYRGEE